MAQRDELIMDNESKGLIFFFKKLNIIFLILSIIASFYIAYTVSTSVQQQKIAKQELNDLIDDDDSFSFSYQSDKSDKKFDGFLFFSLTCFSIFIAIFNYNLILILLKHFSNVAEIKEINKIKYLSK